MPSMLLAFTLFWYFTATSKNCGTNCWQWWHQGEKNTVIWGTCVEFKYANVAGVREYMLSYSSALISGKLKKLVWYFSGRVEFSTVIFCFWNLLMLLTPPLFDFFGEVNSFRQWSNNSDTTRTVTKRHGVVVHLLIVPLSFFCDRSFCWSFMVVIIIFMTNVSCEYCWRQGRYLMISSSYYLNATSWNRQRLVKVRRRLNFNIDNRATSFPISRIA